jgi:hypothetical protein
VYVRFRRALRLLRRQPARPAGRHRQRPFQSASLGPASAPATRPLRRTRPYEQPALSPAPPLVPLSGDDIPLVRPYVLTAEERALHGYELAGAAA